MISLPLISRELRAASRRRATYYSRMWYGLGAVAWLGFLAFDSPHSAAKGDDLLGLIHLCLLLIFLLAGPVLAADSISRERRDGTLGLLFLTPLSVADIVLGKVVSRVFRMLNFGLMMIPFMMIPVLMGGFDLQQLMLCCSILIGTLLVTVASSLLASVLFLQLGVATVWALVLSALVQLLIFSVVIDTAIRFTTSPVVFGMPPVLRSIFLGAGLAAAPLEIQSFIERIIPAPGAILYLQGALVSGAAIYFIGVLLYSLRKVARYSQESFETERQIKFRKRFLKPIVFRGFFRLWITRKLDKNPLLWLEFRSPWQRSARAALLLLLLAVETLILIFDPGELFETQMPLASIFLVMLALKVCSSFQRERESGAFELILVTPMTVKNVLKGRLKAVMSFFMPLLAALLFFGIVGGGFFERFHRYNEEELFVTIVLLGSIISMPVAGLFFALRFRTILAGLIWTGSTCVALPFVAAGLLGLGLYYAGHSWDIDLAVVIEDFIEQHVEWVITLALPAYYCILAYCGWRGSLRMLERRTFLHD